MTTSPYIYGMHEPPPAELMYDGWIVHLVEVGHSPEPHPGIDFTRWERYGNLCRIQHAYNGGGTFPLPGDDRRYYFDRVRTLVQNSTGCDKWIIGNEPNVSVEWPDDFRLWPHDAGSMVRRCASEIHALPGHENDEVLIPPIGPWNVEIGTDWISYFKTLIPYCEGTNGFALHTYSRGPDPASITSEDKMNPPYQAFYNGFRTYQDWLAAIPEDMRHLSVYITETNQNAPWLNENSGWVQEAYWEIDSWNRAHRDQIIRALCLYRWPRYDEYAIDGKTEVYHDFGLAQQHGYKWTDLEPPSGRTLDITATLMIDGQVSGTFTGTLEEVV